MATSFGSESVEGTFGAVVGSNYDFRFSRSTEGPLCTGKFAFLGVGVGPIYTYIHIYISDLFDPISAARRPFGPLVSGQMWERVPLGVEGSNCDFGRF